MRLQQWCNLKASPNDFKFIADGYQHTRQRKSRFQTARCPSSIQRCNLGTRSNNLRHRSAPVVVDKAAQSAATEAALELKERLSVGNWIEMSTLSAIPDNKNYKIVELVNNKAIMIWKVAGGQVRDYLICVGVEQHRVGKDMSSLDSLRLPQLPFN